MQFANCSQACMQLSIRHADRTCTQYTDDVRQFAWRSVGNSLGVEYRWQLAGARRHECLMNVISQAESPIQQATQLNDDAAAATAHSSICGVHLVL